MNVIDMPAKKMNKRNGAQLLVECLKAYGISFSNPDFVRYAESFGAAAFRITKPSQVQRTLKKAFAIKTPTVIDVAIDYRKNLSLLRPSELVSLS